MKIVVGDGGGVQSLDTAVFLKSKGITSGADLKLTVTVDPESITDVADGDTAKFSFTVENIGPAPAWGVELTNSVPVCDDGAWTWSAPEVWQLPDLPSGASFTTNLVVTFGDAVRDYSELTVSGIVVTATGDYDMSNNADDATVMLVSPDSGEIHGRVWDDADQNGILSDSETNLVGVAVSLYTNAVAGIAFATTTTGGDGFYSFGRLPRGEYIVVFDAPDGYNGFSTKHAIADPGVNSDAEAGEPLLRSQTDVLEIAVDGERLENINAGIYRALTIIPALKVWEDGNNQDGIRPDSVTLSLCTNNIVIATANATNGDWSVSWEDVPKYDGTNLIEYIVREDDVPAGYNVDTAYNGQMWEIVNHHTPSNVTVSVTKVWADDSNRDGIRPREVSFTLFGITGGGASTNLVSTTNILASAYAADANEWPFAWENLPMCAAGEVIVYDVREEPLSTPNLASLYTPSVVPNGPYDFTFTNTYTPETIAVTVEKVWNDADNQDGIRPTATFTLLADGVPVGESFTTTDTILTNTWTDLLKYVREAGQTREIAYIVEENTAPLAALGYTTAFGQADNYWTFTNSYTPATVSVTATKVWDDAGDQDGIRPDSVTLTLYADGEVLDSFAATRDSLSKTWGGLPKFTRLNDVSTNIVYDVRENDVPRLYTASYATNVLSDDFSFTITNTHTTDVVTVTATKDWDDDNNQDGIRPTSVTFSLLSNDVAVATADVSESTGWAASWPNLAANVAGSPIAYGVREDAVPDRYTASVATNGLYDFTVTNTHTTDVVTVTVTKRWEDGDDADGLRPASVTFSLLSNDVAVASVDVSESTGWTASWEGLAERSAGVPIPYGVREDNVPREYAASIVTNGLDFTVTNTHIPDFIEVTATKVWDDADNADGLRPASVTFSLLSNDVAVATADVSESTGWAASWPNLAANVAGSPIAYGVREDAVPDGYTASVVTNGLYDFTVTNTHERAVITVTAQKIWEDADNQDGLRPDSVTLTLATNGVAIVTGDVSAFNEWKVTWANLAANAAGSPIAYEVLEETVPDGYGVAIEEGADHVFTVINTHVPYPLDVTATKVWEDANDQDGIRPASVTFALLSNGVSVATSDVSADVGWTTSWTNLSVYAAGQSIAWTVAEDTDLSPDYFTTVSKNGNDWTITNTHTTDVVTVTVQKIWDDADDQDGIRPDSVTFALVSNNVSVATAAVSADTGWTNAWTGLSKRSAGTSIAWTVQEENLSSDYTLVSTESNGNDWTFTNQHIPETIDITVVKVWDDEDDAEGLRPASVSVTLLVGNSEVGTVDLDEAGGWTFAWTNLAKCASGSAIAYSVRENDVPAEYTCTVARSGDTFTVTNTHSTGAPELKTTATWTLNRSDGLIDGTFTLKNVGNKPFAANTDFWLSTPGSRPTWYIYNRTGRMPDGSDYYDFTAAVRAAVKKVGNKNVVLDPGESVVVKGVKIYHKSRISPDKYLNVQNTTHGGRLFHVSDTNRDFILSASELTAAQTAWSSGSLSDDDFLEATRLNGGVAYLWDDSAGNWATLSEDKR